MTTHPCLSDADIFTGGHDVIVIPTNASGIMSDGLAGVARKRFPRFYETYMEQFSSGRLVMGTLVTMKVALPPPYAIVGLHTMVEPDSPGDLPSIQEGLYELARFVESNRYRTVGIPALGCGLGGLDWKRELYPKIQLVSTCFPDQEWYAYLPRKNNAHDHTSPSH